MAHPTETIGSTPAPEPAINPVVKAIQGYIEAGETPFMMSSRAILSERDPRPRFKPEPGDSGGATDSAPRRLRKLSEVVLVSFAPTGDQGLRQFRINFEEARQIVAFRDEH